MAVDIPYLQTVLRAARESGRSERLISQEATGQPTAIAMIKTGRIPSVERARLLCEALGLEFYIGPPRGSGGVAVSLARFDPAADIPVRGWARCSLYGHLDDEREFPDLPMPEGVRQVDADAFFAIAKGASMIPEGIENGDYCLVSPNTSPAPGLRVWLKDRRGRATIKRLMAVDAGSCALRGWLDPEAGRQRTYDDRWMRAGIRAQGAVLAVYRGKPDADRPPPAIPDPKAPGAAVPRAIAQALDLPDGAGVADAVSAIERLSGLSDEIARLLEAARRR